MDGIARADRQLNATPDNVVARCEAAKVPTVRHGDRARKLTICNALDMIYGQRGAYAEAVCETEAALRIGRETSDRVHEGLILNSLGASLNKLRRWDEARTTLIDAVRVNTECREQQLLGHALSALADACMGREQFAESLEYLYSASHIRRLLGDRRGEGWLFEKMARAHRALGNHVEAASATHMAERIAQEAESHTT